MADERFDVLVVGSGPAGSTAALVLARGGARVALVDKARFPRDKACGDLIGPRGVQVLAELGVGLPASMVAGDLVVVGPNGRRIRLPCFPGVTYPGYALTLPRTALDATLHDAALSAGAEWREGRADEPLFRNGALDGFVLATGKRVRAPVVIGADGAVSRVAEAAGLVDADRVLWGYALRSYLDEPVDLPHIVFWEVASRRALPGYGWLFPATGEAANVGLGVGVLSQRAAAVQVARCFGAFLDHLRRLGLGGSSLRQAPSRRLGGWLKMGMVGTIPAAGQVLLVGDAAGLVNPLQGEGIAQALRSGRAAATAVLAGPSQAAAQYRAFLATTLAPYLAVTAPLHAGLLSHPRAIAVLWRLLTGPGLGRAIAGGWSIFWNDLLDGAHPRPARTVAASAAHVGRAVTARSGTQRWLECALGDDPEAYSSVPVPPKEPRPTPASPAP